MKPAKIQKQINNHDENAKINAYLKSKLNQQKYWQNGTHLLTYYIIQSKIYQLTKKSVFPIKPVGSV